MRFDQFMRKRRHLNAKFVIEMLSSMRVRSHLSVKFVTKFLQSHIAFKYLSVHECEKVNKFKIAGGIMSQYKNFPQVFPEIRKHINNDGEKIYEVEA